MIDLIKSFLVFFLMLSQQDIPIKTLHLFPILDKLLIELLKSLSLEDWKLPTIAKLWTVKDIVSHLLDGNLRTLSFSRDNYFGETPPEINSYIDLVAYLNQLNASWVGATKRLSPQVLIALLETTGKEFITQLATLNPFEPALFSVAWAGQDTSENWFHIAREYTEKFIHQQQIRDAVGKEGLMTKELFYPFIDTFMQGLPHTYRNVSADVGTSIHVKILSEIGGEWNLIKTDINWKLTKMPNSTPAAIIQIEPKLAWKLFSKGIKPTDALEQVEIMGNQTLGEIALQMVSVMA